MTDNELETLVTWLRTNTQLGRLSHDEAKAVVTVILTLTPPKDEA